jgi:hypothetical protein
MALAELGDAFGLIVALANPEPAARMFGISVAAEIVRAGTFLALGALAYALRRSHP